MTKTLRIVIFVLSTLFGLSLTLLRLPLSIRCGTFDCPSLMVYYVWDYTIDFFVGFSFAIVDSRYLFVPLIRKVH